MRTLILFAAAALSLHADSFFLTVAGLGGEDQYEQRFTGWASDLNKLLKSEPGAKVDTLSGKEILSLKGHTQEVTSVSFSRDGRCGLSASRDGTALLWLALDWRPASAEAGDAPSTGEAATAEK